MLIGEDRQDEWNDFVAASEHGSALQSYQWGQLKGFTGWEALPVALMDEGRMRACALVLKRELPLIGRALFYAPRGPIVGFEDAEALSRLLGEIRELAREHRALALKVDPPIPAEQTSAVEALRSAGFRTIQYDEKGLGGTQPRPSRRRCSPASRASGATTSAWPGAKR